MSAARSEFKHLEYFYFHNCLYESIWRDNRRRDNRIPTWDVLHTYGGDYKVIVVGDASMSSYELTHPGGSVEHFNEESGLAWLQRLKTTYARVAWLNPVAEQHWSYTPSISLVSQAFEGEMYPLTLRGLDDAMRALLR